MNANFLNADSVNNKGERIPAGKNFSLYIL